MIAPYSGSFKVAMFRTVNSSIMRFSVVGMQHPARLRKSSNVTLGDQAPDL